MNVQPARRGSVKNLTINTDASFYYNHKVGGYGIYIICDLFKITKGGYFKGKVDNSEDAEIMAIGNAAALTLANKQLPTVQNIIINTDCIKGYRRIRRGSDKLAYEVLVLLRTLQERTGAKSFYFKHVKAHNGTPDARSYVNDWCDSTAKTWAKKAIKLKGR